MKEINARWISENVHPRNKEGYKKTFGHVLVIGGSEGKLGAAILCTLAALRSGCGMVTAFIPKSAETALLIDCPEAMTIVDQKISSINLSHFDAIAIGPGMGLSKEAEDTLHYVMLNFKGLIVIDADALTLIAKNTHLLKPNHILTPHPGELASLQGSVYIATEREKQMTRFVSLHPVNLVLKGPKTLVISPNKELMLNTTGNDGMATAGSGDVLAGIIASLCAQKYQIFNAACIGVYLHGLAADYAILHQSRSSLVASDIIENLKNCKNID